MAACLVASVRSDRLHYMLQKSTKNKLQYYKASWGFTSQYAVAMPLFNHSSV